MWFKLIVNIKYHQLKFFLGSYWVYGIIGFSKFMIGLTTGLKEEPKLGLKEDLNSWLMLVLLVGLKDDLKSELLRGLTFDLKEDSKPDLTSVLTGVLKSKLLGGLTTGLVWGLITGLAIALSELRGDV